MDNEKLIKRLRALADPQYREFQRSLLPGVEPERIIGVRTPELRALAKELAAQGLSEDFLSALPHKYYEGNQLHAFLLSLMREYERCVEAVEAFLPYMDNWSTCDQLSPKAFKKHRPELLERIRVWMSSGKTYTVRFGIKMLMEHFLEAEFDPRFPEAVAALRSEEYYVKMMQAWYFATALAKQYDAVVPFLERGLPDPWTHNKAIQKALESFRVTAGQKEHLRTLRRNLPRSARPKTDGT